MGDMTVIIFNVEHGFCAFVKSPTGETLLIDCGCTASFSPIKFLVENKFVTKSSTGHYFTKFILTHPHTDHIEDIDLLSKYKPKIILRQKGYDWEKVKKVNKKSQIEHLDSYINLQSSYTEPADKIDWGFELYCNDYLTPRQASELEEGKMVNNSSIPVVITFEGTKFAQKFLFAGDLEVKAWQELLKRDSFKKAIAGTSFFITSHHGHTSGYCKEIFEAIGKPKINIVSAHAGDDSVDGAYTGNKNATGIKWLNGEELDDQRYMLSTRNDGSIIINVTKEGKYSVSTETFDDNL